VLRTIFIIVTYIIKGIINRNNLYIKSLGKSVHDFT